MPPVSRRARLLDLAALGTILFGAALCLVSNSRMTEIAKLSFKHPGPPSQSALAAADRARYVAYAGVAIIVGGCAIGVAGAIRHSLRKAPRDATVS
jgi:hypothetical protein